MVCFVYPQSRPEEGRVWPAGALVRGVLEVLRCVLERVPSRQRQDLLVGGDEVGHPGNRGDDECLSGGVDVGLRPWQHPHARQLNNKTKVMDLEMVRYVVQLLRMVYGDAEIDERTERYSRWELQRRRLLQLLP